MSFVTIIVIVLVEIELIIVFTIILMTNVLNYTFLFVLLWIQYSILHNIIIVLIVYYYRVEWFILAFKNVVKNQQWPYSIIGDLFVLKLVGT